MTQRNRTKATTRNHARRNRSAMKERTLLIQLLEKREVPAIALIGNELTVTAGDSNDAVVISPQVVNGQSMITARRTETVRTPLGTTVFNESQNFVASRVATLRVTLGNGVNSFRNSTNLPSIVIGGSGNDSMIGGSARRISLPGWPVSIDCLGMVARITWLAAMETTSWKVGMAMTSSSVGMETIASRVTKGTIKSMVKQGRIRSTGA